VFADFDWNMSVTACVDGLAATFLLSPSPYVRHTTKAQHSSTFLDSDAWRTRGSCRRTWHHIPLVIADQPGLGSAASPVNSFLPHLSSRLPARRPACNTFCQLPLLYSPVRAAL